MSFDRHWQEEVGSEDAHGRALWALGQTVLDSPSAGMTGAAMALFERALPAARRTSPRRAPGRSPCSASTLILRRFAGASEARRARLQLAERLFGEFRTHNARRLAVAGGHGHLRQRRHAACAHRLRAPRSTARTWSTTALDIAPLAARRPDRRRRAISCRSAITAGSCAAAAPARFDQQPIEAQHMVDALLEAYSGHRRPALARRGAPLLRMVPRPQRPPAADLRPRHRRLPRRPRAPTASTRTRAPNRRSPGCTPLAPAIATIGADRRRRPDRTPTRSAGRRCIAASAAAELVARPGALRTIDRPSHIARALRPLRRQSDHARHATCPTRRNTVFNPAAAIVDGETAAPPARRGHARPFAPDRRAQQGRPHRLADRSGADASSPIPTTIPRRSGGVEDPRITYLEEQERWAITYTAFSVGGPLVSLATTTRLQARSSASAR